MDETIKPDSGAIPKRKASNKRKVTKVYRDTTTLVGNVHAYSEKLRIVDVHPIVQEYIDNKLKPIVVTPPQKEVPVYDIQWKNKVNLNLQFRVLKYTCFNPCPAEPGYTLFCKQCRSRSVGFFRSQLIWICTVCH